MLARSNNRAWENAQTEANQYTDLLSRASKMAMAYDLLTVSDMSLAELFYEIVAPVINKELSDECLRLELESFFPRHGLNHKQRLEQIEWDIADRILSNNEINGGY